MEVGNASTAGDGILGRLMAAMQAISNLVSWCIRKCCSLGGAIFLISIHLWVCFLELVNPWSDKRRERRNALRRMEQRDQSFIDQVIKPAAAATANPKAITLQSAALTIASRQSAPKDYFFGQLPYEIRDEIQRLAFPPRTLHMCLEYGAPSYLLRQPRHNIVNPDLWGGGASIDAERNITRWTWYGCICVSLPPETMEEDRHTLSHGRANGWWRVCVNGPLSSWTFPSLHAVRQWLETKPECCSIGITGWLRTCRQAYVEGTRLLYGENTIALSSSMLLRGMQDIVSPSITSSIVSLDITWTPSAVPLRSGFVGHSRQKPELRAGTQIIPIFPSLRHLRITCLEQEYSFPDIPKVTAYFTPDDLNAWLARRVPPLLDALVRRIAPSTTDIYVSYVSVAHYRALDAVLIREQGMDVTKPQVCRQRGGLKCWRRMPNDATLQTTSSSTSERGYWLHVFKQIIFSSNLDARDHNLQELYNLRTTPDIQSLVPHWRMVERLENGSYAYSEPMVTG